MLHFCVAFLSLVAAYGALSAQPPCPSHLSRLLADAPATAAVSASSRALTLESLPRASTYPFLDLSFAGDVSDWRRATVPGYEGSVWVADVTLTRSGSEHLRARFPAEQIEDLHPNSRLSIVSFDGHPPLLRSERAYRLKLRSADFAHGRDLIFRGEGGRPLWTLHGLKHPEPVSHLEVRGWPASDRLDLLQTGAHQPYGRIEYQKVPNIESFLKDADPDSDAARALRAAQAHFNAKVSTDIEPKYGDIPMILIGSPEYSAEIYRHADGQLLGVDVHVIQKGAAYQDELDAAEAVENGDRIYRFATLEEARRAGAVESDVSWSAGTTIEVTAEGESVPLATSEFMEWTGF
jgi:hypothetical protein